MCATSTDYLLGLSLVEAEQTCGVISVDESVHSDELRYPFNL